MKMKKIGKGRACPNFYYVDPSLLTIVVQQLLEFLAFKTNLEVNLLFYSCRTVL